MAQSKNNSSKPNQTNSAKIKSQNSARPIKRTERNSLKFKPTPPPSGNKNQ